jgi:hypothetical protein
MQKQNLFSLHHRKIQKKILSIFSFVLLVSNLFALQIAAAADLIPETSLVAQAVDAVAPSDVENLKAIAGDKKITLSWDTSTDNVGIKGYKIYYGANSVTNDGGSYTNGPVDAKNVISYDIVNLTNNTKYYFAVTAYDAAGNESENYSLEVSATPVVANSSSTSNTAANQNDTIAPKVVKAEAVDKNTVKVIFSEGVKLPATNAQSAFSIKEDVSGVVLEVKNAVLDTKDTTDKTVTLTTGDQKVDKSYILTAGIDVKDKAGNPIVSGTSDTGAFVGKETKVEDLKPAATDTKPADTKPADTSDKAAPAFVGVTALNNTTVEITFSEPVILKTDARENFILTEEQNVANVLPVKKVTQGATGMIVTLTTDSQKGINYNLIAVDVADAAGNKMSIENNATMFKGQAAPAAPDTTPTTSDTTTNEDKGSTEVDALKAIPEGAKDFMAKLVGDLVIKLTWAKASENLSDMAQFIVYMSTDRGKTYGEGTVLDPNTLSYDFSNLKPGMMYYFKLTTKNVEGKESTGLITSLTLPGTGPELGLLLLGSLGVGKLFQKKKKKTHTKNS